MINRCNMLSGCVKPTYLVIFKGDDTNFPGNQEIEIVIDTEMDLTGLKAHFRFMDFTQDFNEIPENKKLSIVIPHDKTSAFPIGASDATLFLEDQSGKIRTVSNRIHIVVTNSVHEAYENEGTQSVTVTVKGTVTWDMIEDKPTIPEPSDTDPLMDGEASAGTSDDFSRGDHVHPSDKSKLDGAATYPAWEKNHIYLERTVVSYNGRLWFTQHGVVPILGFQTPPPDEDPDNWVEVYLKDLKQDALTSEQIGYINAVPSKAPLASPTLTGTPTAPTAASGTNTTQIATTAFVQDALNGKRNLTDLLIRGNPTGEGSWFSVNGNTYAYSDGSWINEGGSPFDSIYFDEYEGTYIITGSSDVEFTLDADYSASITYLGTTYTIIGYVGTIAKVSEIPTLTSQLTNDGAPNGGGNAYVMTNDTRLTDARTPTAHHATHAANGSDPLAPADIGAAASTDLPYRLVEPGKWAFRGLPSGAENIIVSWDDDHWVLDFEVDSMPTSIFASGSENDLSVLFEDLSYSITATRASLPGHLLERAGNRVVVTGDTTLTLPEANPGYLRDFLVRLEISGSTVPTITFAAPTGETITYETDGDEFPVPDEAGTWLYSFTESCVLHKFAVSLKKVNTVAQGGS